MKLKIRKAGNYTFGGRTLEEFKAEIFEGWSTISNGDYLVLFSKKLWNTGSTGVYFTVGCDPLHPNQAELNDYENYIDPIYSVWAKKIRKILGDADSPSLDNFLANNERLLTIIEEMNDISKGVNEFDDEFDDEA